MPFPRRKKAGKRLFFRKKRVQQKTLPEQGGVFDFVLLFRFLQIRSGLRAAHSGYAVSISATAEIGTKTARPTFHNAGCASAAAINAGDHS